ncbi:MAG: cysteine peptidase family C39 domain-containing protein [archaeon]
MKIKEVSIIFFLISFMFFTNIFVVSYIGYKNREFNLNSLYGIKSYYTNNILALNETTSTNLDRDFSQSKEYSCGPASLRYLLNYFGLRISEKKLIKLTDTDENGTSFQKMVEALEQLGFQAKGMQVNLTILQEYELPVIAYVDNDHFIVVKNINRNKVEVFDPEPEEGLTLWDKDNFLARWSGSYILKVSTKPINFSN